MAFAKLRCDPSLAFQSMVYLPMCLHFIQIVYFGSATKVPAIVIFALKAWKGKYLELWHVKMVFSCLK